jgi:hypothetical protein
LAVFDVVVINAAFSYGLLHADTLQAALTNPVAAAFIIEALVLDQLRRPPGCAGEAAAV